MNNASDGKILMLKIKSYYTDVKFVSERHKKIKVKPIIKSKIKILQKLWKKGATEDIFIKNVYDLIFLFTLDKYSTMSNEIKRKKKKIF